MKNNNWREKLGALLPENYVAEPGKETISESEKAPKQILRVELDKRNGKAATIVSEFEGTNNELKELAKVLKNKCASGGSQRDGEILIQGDFRVKIAVILQEMGYKVKKINFK